MTASLLFTKPGTSTGALCVNHKDLICDLNLSNIFDAMSMGDKFIYDTAKELMLTGSPVGLLDITYRQRILKDSLECGETIKLIYRALARRITEYNDFYKKSLPAFSSFVTVSARIKDSAGLFNILMDAAEEINGIIDASDGILAPGELRDYLKAFREFFNDAFIQDARAEVSKLRSTLDDSCVSYAASVGLGLKGADYVLRSIGRRGNGGGRQSSGQRRSVLQLSSIGIQAQAGALRDAGLLKMVYVINEVNAKILDRLISFRRETGFYAGCINLRDKLSEIGVPVAFPSAQERGGRELEFKGLVDISLALGHLVCPVGNSLDSCGAGLLMVTGANQGGKSTFLRGLGCAQLMMQCGMFVAAESYSAGCRSGIYTHFCRSGAGGRDSGKLDEELGRINGIIGQIDRDSLVLLNESFSSAGEREACGIAREIVGALHELNIKTVYVTHLYDFASGLVKKRPDGVMLLAAQRNADGTRPYTIIEADPEPTSFGLDIFDEVFG